MVPETVVDIVMVGSCLMPSKARTEVKRTATQLSAPRAQKEVQELNALQVDKTPGHRKAEAQYESLLLQQPTASAAWWLKEEERVKAELRQHQRAHNVVRLNKCTGHFLRLHGLMFRFVEHGAAGTAQMRLCRQVGRKFQPLSRGPAIDADDLHRDECVSFAIWRALQIVKGGQ